MEHAPPTLLKGHAAMKRPRSVETDYWIATAVVALFALAFLLGLAIAQVTA